MSDPLLDQINSLKDGIAQQGSAAKKKYDQSAVGKIQRDTTALTRFLWQVANGFHWVYDKLIRPVYRYVIWPTIGRVWRFYRWLWDKTVYYEDAYGDKSFSKTRGGLMVLATGGFLYFVLLPMLAFFIEIGLYTTTAKHSELLYMANSEEIFPDDNIHATSGCESLPCTAENSIYFRVRPQLFHHLWSLLHNGTFFFPDAVAGAVPGGTISQCTVTSYGIRLKLFRRGFDYYPDMLAAQCEPVRQ